MTRFEDEIREALGSASGNEDENATLPSMIMAGFRGHSRGVALFAWMKMAGTLSISTVAAIAFFLAGSTKGQLAAATIFMAGFVGFAMWWIWYWMFLNRHAELREIKRLELQVAELRERLAD